MTKKHFIELADDLRGENVPPRIVDALCRFMRGQNPRFNEGRWRSYLIGECGPGGGEIKAKKSADKTVSCSCGCGATLPDNSRNEAGALMVHKKK